jgi:hypothetical protein
MQTYVNFAGRCADAFRFYEKHDRGSSDSSVASHRIRRFETPRHT